MPERKATAYLGFRQSHAIIIGIDSYQDGIPPLRTASVDAARLGQILQDLHDYQVHLLLNEAATKDAIDDLFATLQETIDQNDRVLFYFAGHGIALDANDGPNGYLLPCDARLDNQETYVHMPTLHDTLVSLPCRHMMIILDSCFSGAFRWSATRSVPPSPVKVLHKERFQRFIKDPAWQVITSASHDQEAMDERFGCRVTDESLKHSPFASALFDALGGAGDATGGDANTRGDGVVTATELYMFVKDALETQGTSESKRQTPMFWPLNKHDKGEFIFLVPDHELNLPDAPPLTYENNPYRGLEPYEKEHTDLFFGRDEVIQNLYQHVSEHPLSIVLGASGTGKSSVVKAGLVPRLERDVTEKWTVMPVVRPAYSPLRSIIKALTTLQIDASKNEEREQSTGTISRLKIRIATWFKENPDTRLVLVIDQFEELHTMTREDNEREEVLAFMAALLQEHPERFRLILTLRTDFEPQFLESPLQHLWQESRYIIPPMTRENLRDIIEKPARKNVLYFDPGDLVDKLLDEVTATPGALPLLSFTLSELYIRYVNRQSDSRALTMEDYLELEGVVGALRHRAEEEYEALDPFEQHTMRRLILRMIRIDGAAITRQRVFDSDLVFPSHLENKRTQEVIERMVNARLFITGTNDAGERYVEPAHDALVRAWKMLREWVKQENTRIANLRFQQNLAESARQWEETHDEKLKKGLLWRDGARAEVLKQLVKLERIDKSQVAFNLFEKLLDRQVWLGNTARVGVGSRLADLKAKQRPNTSSFMNKRELTFVRESIQRSRLVRLGIIGLFSSTFAALIILLAITASRNEGLKTQMECFTMSQEELTLLDSKMSSDDVFIDVLTRSHLITSEAALAAIPRPAALDTLSEGWSTILQIEHPNYQAGHTLIEDPVTFPFVLARTYGSLRGRIMATGHSDLLAYDADDRFWDLSFSWLTGIKGNSVAISSGHMESFFLYNPEGNLSLASKLEAGNYEVEYMGNLSILADSAQASRPDLLIIPDAWRVFSEEEIKSVETFVNEGGGLLVTGAGWLWQFYGPEPGEEQNEVLQTLDAYPMNQLMLPFGIQWTEDFVNSL